MGQVSVVRDAVEAALAGRVAAPFEYRDRKVAETVSTGIAEMDLLAGGLPRGGLTEICGPPCSGHTSVLVAALAARTAQAEACALVDGRDAFDPGSAEAAGVALEHLLWVRCKNIEQSLRATDLLLHAGGFGMVALDLSDIPAATVRQVPLNAWFRFQRTVENTPTILLLLEQEANAKTCASLVLRLGMEAARWSGMKERGHGGPAPLRMPHTVAALMEGFKVKAEVVRSRVRAVTDIAAYHVGIRRGMQESRAAGFEVRTDWSGTGERHSR